MAVMESTEGAPSRLFVGADASLRAILRSLGTAPSFRDCMRECALTLHQSTEADGATVFRLSEGGNVLEQIHSVGFPRQLTASSKRLGLDRSLTGLAVSSRKLLVSQDIATDQRIAPSFRQDLVAHGMQTVVSLPLFMHAEVVGAITLAWRQKLELSGQDRELLMYIGFGIAIAVEHDLREFESTRDGLTGLLNRRAFDTDFPVAIAEARSANAPMSLAMLDLDNFKACNDTHGHDLGDRILKAAAAQIAQYMLLHRGEAYRVGGEEFALVLPSTSEEEALPLLKRICRGVAALSFLGRDDALVQTTFSAGIAQRAPQSDESSRDFYVRADMAMYKAKNSGKDCIVMAATGAKHA